MTRVHALLPELEQSLKEKGNNEILRDELSGSVYVQAQKFIAPVKEKFDEHYEGGVYSVYLLDHAMENYDRSGNMEIWKSYLLK